MTYILIGIPPHDRIGVRYPRVSLAMDQTMNHVARLDQETEAARSRVLLEQAFSPSVAQYLQQHPESLAGQLREVTLLSVDLCGFAALEELLSPADCYDLSGDVMELLTEIVVAQQGEVVDYYGDGLLTLWNAPLDQADHATLACTAAQEMLDHLPRASSQWRYRLSEPLQLSVGIHTGPTLVGNAGTKSRIKYAPRGSTVNAVSRVQAATKELQLPLLMTKATHDQLSSEFFRLRVCTAKLPGLPQQLDLYTAYPACDVPQLRDHLDRYAEALEWFEAGNLATAERLLEELATRDTTTPARFLAHHTAIQKQAAQGRRASDQSQGPVIDILGE